MKVVVLVPSEEYKRNAGARIRYGRIAPRLAQEDVELSLIPIGDFNPVSTDCDVLVVSKCYDARALVAAAVSRRRGASVGVDLFDDYFSQFDDSRLARFRSWLRQMLGHSDFGICSTASMQATIAQYRPELPTHIVNDPAPDIDTSWLNEQLGRKLAKVQSSGRIQVCWFGIGDNPHFPVGLQDLAAYSDSLNALARGGIGVELLVLTNGRALDAARLAMIRDLPVRASVKEWTEQREAEALNDAFACFLPVNAQRFSTAKSLNRAVTALSAGCQVLTTGFPLYEALDELIYRDPAAMVDDLARGPMRFRPGNVDTFCSLMSTLASRESEAIRPAEFLRRLDKAPPDGGTDQPIFVVHGFATHGKAHKLVQQLGGLSVASPFSSAQLNVDVRFEAGPGRVLRMLMRPAAAGKLLPHARPGASEHGLIGKRQLVQSEGARGTTADLGSSEQPPLPLQLARYPNAISGIAERLDASFGKGTMILSETSHLAPETADLER